MLAEVLFSVQLLSQRADSPAILNPTATQRLMEPIQYRRPSTLAFSASGVAAIVVGRSENHAVNDDERIVIFDHGAHIVNLPSPTRLKGFFLYPAAANLFIRNLVLSAKNTPIIALSVDVSGAYGATQEASFSWMRGEWAPALRSKVRGIPQNIWVAASDSVGEAYVGDYLYLDPAHLQNASHDALYNLALLRSKTGESIMGFGTPTSMLSDIAVGYDDCYVPGSSAQSPVWAWKWANDKRSLLGRGVAWSVNSRGEVVGDNRKTLRDVGVPMLWSNGAAVQLINAPGTAFAVGNDGSIVGEVGSRGFLIQRYDRSRRVVWLDSVVSRDWHVEAGYFIDAFGDILAVASRKGTGAQVVILHRLRANAPNDVQ